MPILNKPVVFQPHKSFSVDVFLIYAGCVPKVWKLMRNKYISVISVITDLNLALRILPYFPRKSWSKFISNFIFFKKNNIFLHSWKRVHRNLSVGWAKNFRVCGQVISSSFWTFHFTHFTFHVAGHIAFSRRSAKRDVSRKKQRGDW